MGARWEVVCGQPFLAARRGGFLGLRAPGLPWTAPVADRGIRPVHDMSEYRVQFDVFEGPLDLLLHLVKKQEVDIYQINLTRVASEFVEYLNRMRSLDLEVAGEFLVMAATLIFIKSRELLPKEQRAVVTDDDTDEEDPRFELIRRLVEYKKFKDAAAQLQDREGRMADTYERRPGSLEFRQAVESRSEPATVWDLVAVVSTILKRFNARDDIREIQADPYTVSEKMESLRAMILSRPRFRVSELFAEAHSRTEVVVTFLAILELTRLKQLHLNQSEDFGEIEVSAVAPSDAAPTDAVGVPVTVPALDPNLDLPGLETPPPPPERSAEQILNQELPDATPLAGEGSAPQTV